MMEITQSVQQSEKQMKKKNESTMRSMGQCKAWQTMYYGGSRQKKEKGVKTVFEETMAKTFQT